VKSAGLILSVTSVAPATVKFNPNSESAAAKALIMFCRFISISPLVDLGGCGSGRDKEPSGARVLRLIQIRLATPSFEKIRWVVKAFCANGESRSRAEWKAMGSVLTFDTGQRILLMQKVGDMHPSSNLCQQ